MIAKGKTHRDNGQPITMRLTDQVANPRLWPTPSANKITPNTQDTDDLVNSEGGMLGQGQKPYDRRTGKPVQTCLADATRLWPTPTSRDHKDTGDAIKNGKVEVNCLLGRAVLPSKQEGSLNPDWVEWLMGWPVGWTSPDPLPPENWERWPTETQAGTWWNVDPADTGELSRLTTIRTNRSKRLKALGNGQVPKVVEMAWEFGIEKEV